MASTVEVRSMDAVAALGKTRLRLGTYRSAGWACACSDAGRAKHFGEHEGQDQDADDGRDADETPTFHGEPFDRVQVPVPGTRLGNESRCERT